MPNANICCHAERSEASTRLISLEQYNLGVASDPKSYFVYILGNGKGALYVGVTNDLERRIQEHKTKLIKGFTSKYGVDQLLFYEGFGDISDAIAAEKEIKGWVRKKKLQLVRTINPTFKDLSEDWV